MARKGKLSSSPFHIETNAYKYAIEHENDGYQIAEANNDCAFYSANTKYCTLWNSGYQSCNKHRCRFYLTGLRRLGKCTSCAYYYKGCRHPKKLCKDVVECEDASFCTFYLTEQMDSRKYHALYECTERIALSSELKRARKIVKSGKRSIIRLQGELGRMEVGTAAYQSLVKQIEKKRRRVEENTNLIDNLEKRVKVLSGAMKKWPKKITIRKN